MTTPSAEESYDSTELMDVNVECCNRIAALEKNLRKTGKDRIKRAYLEPRKETAQGYWREFQARHNEIIAVCKGQEHSEQYFVNDVFSIAEDSYFACMSYIHEKMSELTPAHLAAASTSVDAGAAIPPAPLVQVALAPGRELKLPPVVIPKFDGTYQNWPPFYDMFKSLVHDKNDMPEVHKLHYLKANLIGEAEHLLRHFQLTEANYQPSWDFT